MEGILIIEDLKIWNRMEGIMILEELKIWEGIMVMDGPMLY